MVIGGQTTGRAALDATARSNGTPSAGPQSLNSPVNAFTEVARKLAGQPRPAMPSKVGLDRAASSLTVSASRAVRPIAARPTAGVAEVAAFAHSFMNCCKASLAFGDRPLGDGGSTFGGAKQGLSPRARSAPMTAPADVPMIKSASRTSTPDSSRPAARPQWRARPSAAPPPSTRARLCCFSVECGVVAKLLLRSRQTGCARQAAGSAGVAPIQFRPVVQ